MLSDVWLYSLKKTALLYKRNNAGKVDPIKINQWLGDSNKSVTPSWFTDFAQCLMFCILQHIIYNITYNTSNI